MAWRSSDDTIFALATGAGRGGVAVMRISGRETGTILDRMIGHRPRARYATLRRVRADDGELLDHALALWFPAPGSYTGEDCAELHLHAGPAVIDAVADALHRLGARPAEAGEFTQRAFLRGRMDLLEAEGVADLVEAETQAQRRQALAQTEGALSAVYRRWAELLRQLVASHEALIDFPDEAATASPSPGEDETIAGLEADIAQHLTRGRDGEVIRSGFVVAVIGAPNVGKSSLVNALTRREISIVSPRAGTTRDAVEARTVLAGLPVTLVDTAGLRDSDDDIEQEGIRRARQRAAEADLVIQVTEGGVRPESVAGPSSLWVSNKSDATPSPEGALGVSALTGDGIDALRVLLSNEIGRVSAAAGTPLLTRARHRDCLARAAQHLHDARLRTAAELRAEELRLALEQLGRLTGEVGVEDILGDIFSRFCIGK
jgi:tRNA modification GTPase